MAAAHKIRRAAHHTPRFPSRLVDALSWCLRVPLHQLQPLFLHQFLRHRQAMSTSYRWLRCCAEVVRMVLEGALQRLIEWILLVGLSRNARSVVSLLRWRSMAVVHSSRKAIRGRRFGFFFECCGRITV